MASQISGLDPLHGYLKHGNLVVEMKVPYIEIEGRHEKFVERKMELPAPLTVAQTTIEPVAAQQMELKPTQGQQHFFE
jgi:uncharacterized protein (DUF1697 family)